jgi:hypothetical protein
MPDIVLDGASETPDESLPKPSFEAASQSDPSESVSAIAAQYEQRLKETKEELRREFQGKQDKDLASVRKTYGDLSELQTALAAVKAGGDPEKIYAAIEQRNLYAKVDELEKKLSAPNQSSPGGSEADEAYAKAVGLLKETGLDNDPDVMKLMGGRYKNANDFLFEVNRFTLQRNTKRPASPASASSPAGGGGVVGNVGAVQAQIDALLGSREVTTVAGREKLAALRSTQQQLEGA